MLDTGSEVNLIKIGVIFYKTLIQTEKIISLRRIGPSYTKSLGTYKWLLLGVEVTFIVVPNLVPNEFQIPTDGRLGVALFRYYYTKIDFNSRIFTLNNKVMTFYKRNLERNDPQIKSEVGRIINIKSDRQESLLPFIDIVNPPTYRQGGLMLDSRSEANIMKSLLIPENCEINRSEFAYLKGIGDELTETLGTAEITIFGEKTIFHIVPDDFGIPCEGVLGAAYFFLAHCTIDFKKNEFRVVSKIATIHYDHTLSDFDSSDVTEMEKRLQLPIPRAAKYENLSEIGLSSGSSTIANSSTESLYRMISDLENYSDIENITDIEDYYSSNRIAILKEDLNLPLCPKRQIFHITQQEVFADLNVNVPSKEESDECYDLFKNKKVELYDPFDLPTACVFGIQVNTGSILDKLRLDHLQGVEKNHVLKIINKYKDIFLLEGQHLGSATNIKHKIITTTDVPKETNNTNIKTLSDKISQIIAESEKNSKTIKPKSTNEASALNLEWASSNRSHSNVQENGSVPAVEMSTANSVTTVDKSELTIKTNNTNNKSKIVKVKDLRVNLVMKELSF
ncbi:hypothetical protein TSAR_015605 [Trichomalopsis sarcophagae]|uniref:Peptidase A2 domain-containing protein n=1 Tax=Trichomalopsis sarcophagae TaxID=543379 RepID=A0A232F2A0_9HYME|nr:hypothetical protein TSAR_015605 [Trichomalopsis sarcophagae]